MGPLQKSLEKENAPSHEPGLYTLTARGDCYIVTELDTLEPKKGQQVVSFFLCLTHIAYSNFERNSEVRECEDKSAVKPIDLEAALQAQHVPLSSRSHMSLLAQLHLDCQRFYARWKDRWQFQCGAFLTLFSTFPLQQGQRERHRTTSQLRDEPRHLLSLFPLDTYQP